MVPGFNTDFKYRGETYHVQTEDNGVGNPVVVTLLYHKGAILASRRTSYRDLAANSGFERELMALMKTQHKDLMRALLAGEFDKNGVAPDAEGSGEHPAVAAAAVTAAKPLPPPQPSAEPAPAVALRAATVAPVPPPPTSVSRPATTSLDEAIRHYLLHYSATVQTVH